MFGAEWLWFASAAQLAEPGSYVAQVYAGWPLMVVREAPTACCAASTTCAGIAPGRSSTTAAGACTQPRVPLPRLGVRRPTAGLRSARDFGADARRRRVRVAPDPGRGVARAGVREPRRGRDAAGDDLGDFFAEIDGFPLETMTLVRSFRHDLACNWKTYADNYLEGYHIPLLHPELNRQFDAKRYRVELGDRYCRHTAPPRDGHAADRRPLAVPLAEPRDEHLRRLDERRGDRADRTRSRARVLYNHFFVDPDAPDVADVIALADTVMERGPAHGRGRAAQPRARASTTPAGSSPRHENGVRSSRTSCAPRSTRSRERAGSVPAAHAEAVDHEQRAVEPVRVARRST